MTPYYRGRFVRLYHGNCRDIGDLDRTFSAIVTDPPYGLSFMGLEWDHGVPAPSTWRRLSRHLAPGSPLLVFGGTRTFHRLAVNLEDADLQIRDTLCWLYGSGFPKSLDISKAIDKQRHDRTQILEVTRWIARARDRADLDNSDIDYAFGFNGMAGHWTSQGSQPAVPTIEQVPDLLRLLKVDRPPSKIRRLLLELNGRKGQPGENWWKRPATAHRTDGVGNTRRSIHKREGFARSRTSTFTETAAATDISALWQGYGTALKPAWEPILLAIKPPEGTFADNARKHGVAGLNIEGARIPGGMSDTLESWAAKGAGGKPGAKGFAGQFSARQKEAYRKGLIPLPSGRWPANLLLDEESAAMLDQQTGKRRSAGDYPSEARTSGIFGDRKQGQLYADSGGASRFFYIAKASRRERGSFNTHPTVKPVELMRYLLTLVTYPERNLVLDPFAGSGSTLIAAHRLRLPCIGIELDEATCEIAARRLDKL